MKKQRLLTLAIVICLLVCLFTACSNTSNSGGGKPNNSGGTPDCTHTSTRWITDEEATCTTDGSKHKECSSCGKTLDTESISAKGHDYDETVVPPTEEQQGYTLHQCSRCGDNYKDNFVDPPTVEYTEAQYKQMFETKILSKIQNEYNENTLLEQNNIYNLQLELINYETGDVYFACDRNGRIAFIIATHEEITEWATYEALYENCPTDGFTFSSAYTIQEDDLAEEIVEFALTQPELQEYIEQNDLDLSEFIVVNVSQFKCTSDGEKSDIVLLTEEGVLTFSLVGVTGTCSSQEEYLAKMKKSTIVEVNNIKLTDHYEIPVATE